MALGNAATETVTYIDPALVRLPENEIEYEAFDAVEAKLLPLLGEEKRKAVMEEYEDGGYPAGALSWALNALQQTIPRTAVNIIRSYIPKLKEFNNDWFGVERALDRAIERCGIDEAS